MADPIPSAPDQAHALRYMAGAVICAAANNAVLIGSDAAGLGHLAAVMLAWFTGGTIGYLWHHRVTFRIPAHWLGYLQMMAGSALAIPLAWGVIALLRGPAGLPMWLAALGATAAMVLYNYLNARLAILRRFVHRQKESPSHGD